MVESASCTNLFLHLCHFTLRHRHLAGASIPLATLVIALLQILGVPLSKKNPQFGHKVDYLGWSISLWDGKFWALMNTDKLQRLLRWIAGWRGHPAGRIASLPRPSTLGYSAAFAFAGFCCPSVSLPVPPKHKTSIVALGSDCGTCQPA